MKTINAIVKVLTALATIAGAVYIIATYGDQIVAWAKEIWEKLPNISEKYVPVEKTEEPAEPTAEVENAEETASAEEAPVETPAAEENAPVADEADFEG